MAQAQILYLATTAGVVLLSNPGRTDRWLTIGVELPDHALQAVTCESDNPMNALAWGEQQCWQTQDGGQTWHEHEWSMPPAPATQLVVHGEPATFVRISHEPIRLERSDDGATWQHLSLDTAGTWTVLLNPRYHQDAVYAATANGELWCSHDRARTWTRLKRDLPPITALALGRVIS
ncbi:MAG: hypothetical protein KAX40_05090 [Herpetosiphon sp.]|nr:hypothetical protein [Herpetosiphon sp.]